MIKGLWEKAHKRSLDRNTPVAAIPHDFDSLTTEQRVALSDQIRTSLDRAVMPAEERVRLESILQSLSTLSLVSAVESFNPSDSEQESPIFRLGDMVRSSDAYWSRTGQHLTGSITRLEPVPENQIASVGSTHWAHLNSGDGPVSLAILEKVGATAERRAPRPLITTTAGSDVETHEMERHPEALGVRH